MRGRKTIGDTTGTARRTARWIALGVPSFLLGGALISQYVFGLFPCEMCCRPGVERNGTARR